MRKNTDKFKTYETEDILREYSIDEGTLKHVLFEKGIIVSNYGEISINIEFIDWALYEYHQGMTKQHLLWTELGWNGIAQIFKKKLKVDNCEVDRETVERKLQMPTIKLNQSQLQKTFKTRYAEALCDSVKKKENLDFYGMGCFPIDSDNILYIPSIVHPDGLLEKMHPTTDKDFDSAIALYEAYKDLTPLQASDKSFWIYLGHTELFSYVQKRYPEVLKEGFENENYVLDHWFFTRTPLRHVLAGLWWAVYLTVDDSCFDEHKYDYTRFLFSRDTNMRAVYLGNSILFRHKEAAIGILKFLMGDDEVCSAFFRQRARFIAKYFNQLGGTKQLVSLDRNFFYNELVRIRERILQISSDDDVKNFKW